MALHRAHRCIIALKDLLIAANTRAGSNVEIGRTAVIDEQDSIDLNIGPDVAINEFGTDNTQFVDSVLRMYVDLHMRTGGHEELVIERLFEMRAQTHIAILADYTLGLTFGVVARYQGTDEFDPEYAGDRVGSLRTVWDIAYRMDYADPTT